MIEVVEKDDGSLATEVVKKVDGVNQTLGMPKDKFDAMGRPGRDTPTCG